MHISGYFGPHVGLVLSIACGLRSRREFGLRKCYFLQQILMKHTVFKINLSTYYNSENAKSSTSPPGGNQVDGLSPASILTRRALARRGLLLRSALLTNLVNLLFFPKGVQSNF